MRSALRRLVDLGSIIPVFFGSAVTAVSSQLKTRDKSANLLQIWHDLLKSVLE
jgi:hypothetical protein